MNDDDKKKVTDNHQTNKTYYKIIIDDNTNAVFKNIGYIDHIWSVGPVNPTQVKKSILFMKDTPQTVNKTPTKYDGLFDEWDIFEIDKHKYNAEERLRKEHENQQILYMEKIRLTYVSAIATININSKNAEERLRKKHENQQILDMEKIRLTYVSNIATININSKNATDRIDKLKKLEYVFINDIEKIKSNVHSTNTPPVFWDDMDPNKVPYYPYDRQDSVYSDSPRQH
jgi:hypothetical protein